VAGEKLMILPRLQLYALVGLAFVAGLFGIYWRGVQRGIARAEVKVAQGRLRAMETAKEVEDEVRGLGSDALRERASRWLRR
jgi:hypothetical protein